VPPHVNRDDELATLETLYRRVAFGLGSEHKRSTLLDHFFDQKFVQLVSYIRVDSSMMGFEQKRMEKYLVARAARRRLRFDFHVHQAHVVQKFLSVLREPEAAPEARIHSRTVSSAFVHIQTLGGGFEVIL